jgi:hypothetical protein
MKHCQHFSVKHLGLLAAFCTFALLAAAQTKTNPAAPGASKEQVALDRARANQAKIEKKVAYADSLISSGTTIIDECDGQISEIEAKRKQLDKEHATKLKELTKQSNSKDKEEALAAKAELKKLDLQYKADVKASDTEHKALVKKSTTASASVQKGKTTKKDSGQALKAAQKATAAAEKALNGPEPKKKK